jgi:AAA15 family ATPase/GTPase
LESAGTKQAITIYSLFRTAVLNNKGLIIDEFNNKLHPLLQKYLIDIFYNEDTVGQLIYTTHDTFLLDKQYMRRDQIWFTQKDRYGATELYSLVEYKVRNSAPYEKEYLMGKYGGIPLVGRFERLFETHLN